MFSDWSTNLNIIFFIHSCILIAFVISWFKFGFFDIRTILLLMSWLGMLAFGSNVERKEKKKKRKK